MISDYSGPRGRLTIEAAVALDPRTWAAMPKADGAFVRLRLDGAGRVASIIGRSGRQYRELADLVGVLAGPPDSLLDGEADIHTEAGKRSTETRGWANVHLFDCPRYAGRDVTGLPFGERYGLLHRAQAELEQDGRARHDWWLEGRGGQAFGPDGRFVRPVPRDLRRLPVLPLARGPGSLELLWVDHVERGGGEGLVACRLDAPLGRRGAKRKVKATDTLDCCVLAVGGGAATLEYRGHVFAVSARGRWAELRPGEVVECAADGWYEAGATPRFARLVRRRPDLTRRT